MDTKHAHSTSVWMDSAPKRSVPTLEQNLDTDVCVIGAGIAGLTTAYLLAKEGKQVIVLESKELGGFETARTTAHLSYVLDELFDHLESVRGEEIARLATQSHRTAIDTIEQIVKDEKIDCDFTRLPGYLFLGEGQKEEDLTKEFEAARRAKADVTRKDSAPVESLKSGPCLEFPNQGRFHPLRYLDGIVGSLLNQKQQLFQNTHVINVTPHEGSILVETRGGFTVTAKSVVIATNAPISDNAEIYTKQAPYTTYVSAFPIPKGSIPDALYWDMEDPYHYVRVQQLSDTEDVLIVGGEDHKTGEADDAEDRFKNLDTWARDHFKVSKAPLFRWSGMVLETIDDLALIGKKPHEDANIYVATGDSGMGMTHGTIAGILLTDMIMGRKNPWEDVYDPSRKPLKTLGTFLKEGGDVAMQMGKHVTGGDVASEKDIKPNEGAILREGIHKIAAYRDENGTMHRCSAVCPHKGCLVAWNSFEKTWDCPCHGSRYDKLGRVINGPSLADLKKIAA